MKKNISENLLREEKIEDFFDFLNQNPQKASGAAIYYTAPVRVNKFIQTDSGKEPNPMFGKLFKNTMFLFRWQDTYNRAVERTNPEHEMGQRSGTFEKVEGYDMLESGKSGLYLPIIPTGSEAAYSVLEDDGTFRPISNEEAYQYMPPKREYAGGSGVNFRPLIVDRIYKIKAGGNDWTNPDFKYEYVGPGKSLTNESIEKLHRKALLEAEKKQLMEEFRMIREDYGNEDTFGLEPSVFEPAGAFSPSSPEDRDYSEDDYREIVDDEMSDEEIKAFKDRIANSHETLWVRVSKSDPDYEEHGPAYPIYHDDEMSDEEIKELNYLVNTGKAYWEDDY